MKTKLTLKYSSFFFCNNIQLKKGKETEIDTDVLTEKDIVILNAYISSGGIVSSEGMIPVVLKQAETVAEEVKETVSEEAEEVVKDESQSDVEQEEVVEKETVEDKEVTEEASVAKPTAKKTTTRTTKKTK